MKQYLGAVIIIAALILAGGGFWASTAPQARAAEGDAAGPAAAKTKNKYKKSKLTSDESEAVSDRRTLLLTTGEDRAVDLDFEVTGRKDGIAIGNPQVVNYNLVNIGEKRQIVFKPLKAGDTTVTVRDADGTLRLVFLIHVTGSNLLRTAAEIRDLLRDVEGLNIRVVGTKVILEGELLVPVDYGRLLTVIQDKGYADVVMNMTTLSSFAMQLLARKIQEDINAFAPNVRTRLVNGLIFLEGTVDSQDQAVRAKRISELYLPDLRPGALLEKDPSVQRLPPRSLVQNFIVINPAPARKQEKLVRVTIHFVELSKDYNKVFGFKWEPGFTSSPSISVGKNESGGAGATGSSFSATISSLLPKLQSAQAAGYARVLKTGTVIVRSGQPAKLVEQTEFPFMTQDGKGGTVGTSKQVGLSVAVTPQIVGQSEDIQMDLDLDQSNVVGRVPSGGAPTTANHKVVTKIYVKSTESAAVAGVMSNSVGTDFNKDDPKSGAFEGADPLFTLMHSKAYRKQKSQFVIFVTPQIIENASEGTDDLKKNFRVKVN
ncbi:pilus assembly protein N-terminal domain-containing protein [Bdellovibrionota bacterium FG-2]